MIEHNRAASNRRFLSGGYGNDMIECNYVVLTAVFLAAAFSKSYIKERKDSVLHGLFVPPQAAWGKI